jgi:CheY-like chemotaxis protein
VLASSASPRESSGGLPPARVAHRGTSARSSAARDGIKLAGGSGVPAIEHAALARRYHRVLVVDDDPEVRELMQEVLERRGFEVVAVESGAEALGYLARDTASLILLDLDMDDINGWEVLSVLKRHPAFGSFRVIVVSGASGTVPKWAGHLRKPFRVEALLELLASDPVPAASARERAS